ncbi:MAG: HEAT repeat domain-containing protein, partial [Promethearchaeota archaeon]
NLNNVISELILNQSQLVNYDISTDQSLPKFYSANLFMRMFNILDKPKKDLIIKSLIEDLNKTQNNDIKRCVINLLSTIKDNKIYDALIKMIHDDDWLIKLYVIKSLYKFDDDEIKNNFTEPLKKLLRDKDSDVREAASSLLSKIS